MQFEQYHPQELLTPSIDDGGVQKLNSSLTSLDFYLLDDIDVYLSPIQSKAIKNDLNNDSPNDNSQCHEELFSDFDLADFNDFDETSDFLADSISTEDIDLEKWISQASFPSPPTDTNTSSLFNVEETSPLNKDMIVPPSPSLSSSSSSNSKKPKLTTVERKLRKKDQNKTAAEKYRIKKKSERHQLLDRHSKLKDTNKELKLELENLTYRIQQFKTLFADLLQNNLPISN